MRKLLINSTALATVAGLTASVALADVSITATTEYAVSSRDSTIAASNGGFQTQTSELGFTFSSKTDSGISLKYNTQFSGTAAATPDESNLSISGGFGKVVLGMKDGASGTYGMGATDLIAEESGAGATTSHTISTGSDISLGTNDNNKIAYHLPAMGGLTAGVSFEDSGTSTAANTATDLTSVGARYVTALGGMDLTLAAAQSSQESAIGVATTKATNMGVKVVKGNFSAIYATTGYTADGEDRTSSGYALSYNMGDGLIVGAYKDNSKDASDAGEKFTISGIEAQYTLAAGLTAVINMDNFDYDTSTDNSAGSDDGNLTKLTIKAAF